MLCSKEMQKRDSKNLPLSYYIFGAVNNRAGLLNLTQIVTKSQLDAQSIGKRLVVGKPIWQRVIIFNNSAPYVQKCLFMFVCM